MSLKQRLPKQAAFGEWDKYLASKKMKIDSQLKQRKLDELFFENKDETDIFNGVSFYLDGYTGTSEEMVKRLILTNGGTYNLCFSSKVTHIIASTLPESKMKLYKKQIVINLSWIIDSVNAGKRLPHHNYLLYPPENSLKQRTLHFENLHAKDALKGLTISPTAMENSAVGNIVKDSNRNHSVNFASETHYGAKHLGDSDIQNVIPLANLDSKQSTQKHSLEDRNPDILSQFYSRSRLHHISTLKQELKHYVHQLAKQHDGNFPGRQKLKEVEIPNEEIDFKINNNIKVSSNIVMHIDMDCFFVSVGLKNKPHLKSYPVAVAHSRGIRNAQDESNVNSKSDNSENSNNFGSLSEIACCSYDARKAGVKNGMFLGEALKLCPRLKTIPYNFQSYREVSFMLCDIIASYTLDIEVVSCDELYIFCSNLFNETPATPHGFASFLRTEIEEKTGCTSSVGIGNNILIARLATKSVKPNGQFYVPESEVEKFMRKQKVDSLPGVGRSTSSRLQKLQVTSCEELQALTLQNLKHMFGCKFGQDLYNLCRGRSRDSPEEYEDEKSASSSINYGINFDKECEVHDLVKSLSLEVSNKLKERGQKGRLIIVAVMIRDKNAPVRPLKYNGHGPCTKTSKSVTLNASTDKAEIIGNECLSLLSKMKFKPQDYRGFSICVKQLIKSENKRNETIVKSLEEKNNETQNYQRSIQELDQNVFDIHCDNIQEEITRLSC